MVDKTDVGTAKAVYLANKLLAELVYGCVYVFANLKHW